MIEQRVAAGEQHDIEAHVLHGFEAHFPFVDAEANGRDRAGQAQFFERPESAAGRQLIEVRGIRLAVDQRADIVHQQDIDAREAEPLQAHFPGTHDAVVGVVVHGLEWQRRVESVALRFIRASWNRPQQTAGFGGHHDVSAAAHAVAHPAFAQARPVVGRRIHITDTHIQRCLNREGDLRFRHTPKQVAQRCGAKPQLAEFEAGRTDSAPRKELAHSWRTRFPYRGLTIYSDT